MNTLVKETILKDFNTFALHILSINPKELIEHIHKSPYINVDLYKDIYSFIQTSNDSIDTITLTHKLMYPLVKEVIGSKITLREIETQTELPLNNYIHLLRYNKHIDFVTARKHLTPYFYNLYLIHVNTPSLQQHSIKSTGDIQTLANKYTSSVTMLEKYYYSHLFSIHDDIRWSHALQYITDHNKIINMNSLCSNTFDKEIYLIKEKCKLKWQAICKIENWIFNCYWHPKSTFRQKINTINYLESIGQSTSSTVADGDSDEDPVGASYSPPPGTSVAPVGS